MEITTVILWILGMLVIASVAAILSKKHGVEYLTGIHSIRLHRKTFYQIPFGFLGRAYAQIIAIFLDWVNCIPHYLFLSKNYEFTR